MKGPLFYSKILLFGEYGIIKDSKGLSIPYNSYKGNLQIEENLSPEAKKSNTVLRKFIDYLKQRKNSSIGNQLNLSKLSTDVKNGLYFESNIPQKYGIGSSGALVAAIYDKYALQKTNAIERFNKEKLLRLKIVFSKMESFFHGTSSGIDPLNSFLSIPILFNSKTDIEITGIPSRKNENRAVFLLDSKTIGKTATMVEIFMTKMKNEGFRNILKNQFIKHTNACIDDFLEGNVSSFFKNITKLSHTVLENFKPMIPASLHKIWEQGINNNLYYLKLCGSGGGGYILGFTRDFNKTKATLKNYKLEVIYTF